jgi:carboxypeptidase family protein
MATGLTLLLPTVVRAQSAIAGQVTDSSGAVLPGVTVEASSVALIEGTRSAVTDGQGRYTVDNLRPGTYKVTFTLPGFSTSVRDGIELVGNFTAPVNAQLKVGAVEESITVTSETPLVDVRRTTTQQVLTREVLDALPTGRSAWGQAATLPGTTISTPDVGGLGGVQQAYVSNQGSLINDMQWQIDGLNASSGLSTGLTSSAYQDNGAFQEITYATVAGTAEAQASGVIVNMIPKDGGNAVKGSGLALFSNSSLYSSNYSDALKQQGLLNPGNVEGLWDYNVSVGGPIKRDRLWFFESTRWWGTDKLIPNTFNEPGVPPQGQYRYISRLTGYLVRLTEQANSKNKIALHYNWLPRTRPHIANSSGAFVPGLAPDATLQSVTPTPYEAQVKWTSTLTNRVLVEVGYEQNHYTYTATYQDSVAPGAIMHQDTVLNTQWNAGVYDFTSHSQYQALVGKFSYVTGSHSFKMGVEYDHAWTHTIYRIHGDLYQQYRSGVPYQVQVYNTPVAPVVNNLDDAFGTFVQDSWTISHLTVNGGIRYDHMQQGIPAQTSPGGTFVPARNFAAVPLPTWNNWSPRLGVAYDLAGNARTAFKANFGRYITQDVASLAAKYNPLALQSDNRSWTDANGDDVAQPGEIGPSTNRNFGLAAGATKPDPNLTRGYNYLYNVGVQHQLLPRVSIAAGYYHRVYRNRTWTNNLLTTFDSYTEIDIANPNSSGQTLPVFNLKPAFLGLVQNVDQNSTQNLSVYNGYEVGGSARFGKGGTLLAGIASGLTRNRNCQVADPNEIRFCDQTHYDIPWNTQAKISGAYPLPWGVSASVVFQSLPGAMRTVSYIVTRAQVPALTLSSVTIGPTATNPGLGLNPPGTLYYPRLNQLDLKFSKTIKYGRTRVEPQVGIFNATNSATILNQNNTYGPSLNQVQQILDGRVVRFGVQVDF